MTEYLPIQTVLDDKYEGKEVAIRGWVHRERSSNKFVFLVIRDSSNIIQAVVKAEENLQLYEDAKKLTMESSLKLKGTIHKDERAPTGYELRVSEIEIVNIADVFPITKDQSEEFLMDKRHLWLRSQKLNKTMKVRSAVFGAIDDYFRGNGFYEIQAPSFTPNACEGGSTLFEVKYFDDKVYLTQSWQLYAEAMVSSLEKIYCIAPSFRAERSKTSRHLTEFWHAEMELAWAHLDDAIRVAEGLITNVCKTTAEKHPNELKDLGRDPKELLNMKPPYPRIKYREALEILKDDGMDVPWGKDLRTLEEKQLMTHYDKPLFITHYPKEIMAFYKPRDPENPDLALCFDVIAPDVGEIIGGSERDTDISEMKKVLEKEGESLDTYEWYFDTRKYGAVPHSGFGFGVDRVIQWICKLPHIRDAIPFPRTLNRIYP